MNNTTADAFLNLQEKNKMFQNDVNVTKGTTNEYQMCASLLLEGHKCITYLCKSNA